MKRETSLSALWQVACLTVLFYSPIIWKDQNKFVKLKLGTVLSWWWNNLFVVAIKPTNPWWSKIKVIRHLYRAKHLGMSFQNKKKWLSYHLDIDALISFRCRKLFVFFKSPSLLILLLFYIVHTPVLIHVAFWKKAKQHQSYLAMVERHWRECANNIRNATKQ